MTFQEPHSQSHGIDCCPQLAWNSIEIIGRHIIVLAIIRPTLLAGEALCPKTVSLAWRSRNVTSVQPEKNKHEALLLPSTNATVHNCIMY